MKNKSLYFKYGLQTVTFFQRVQYEKREREWLYSRKTWQTLLQVVFVKVNINNVKKRQRNQQIANIHWIIEKAREFQNNIYFCFINYAKAIVWITIKCGKFWKRWDYQTTWPAFWETYMQVRKQQLELDMEQQTSSK